MSQITELRKEVWRHNMQDFVFLFIKILLFCLVEIVVGHILIHIEDKEDSREDDDNAGT